MVDASSQVQESGDRHHAGDRPVALDAGARLLQERPGIEPRGRRARRGQRLHPRPPERPHWARGVRGRGLPDEPAHSRPRPGWNKTLDPAAGRPRRGRDRHRLGLRGVREPTALREVEIEDHRAADRRREQRRQDHAARRGAGGGRAPHQDLHHRRRLGGRGQVPGARSLHRPAHPVHPHPGGHRRGRAQEDRRHQQRPVLPRSGRRCDGQGLQDDQQAGDLDGGDEDHFERAREYFQWERSIPACCRFLGLEIVLAHTRSRRLP